MSALADFHFLRPWWLLTSPCAIALWFLLRRKVDEERVWHGIVAPHLLPHLLLGGATRSWLRPHHVLLATWIVAILALAGPTWRHEPSPFATDEAGLVIVLEVRPSMLEQDVQPSRLSRSIQKIKDIMAARPGAKTGLVAYAGSAHRVMPLTDDPSIVNAFASALAPDLMPIDGDATASALRLAASMITDSHQEGSIILIADAIGSDQVQPDLPRSTILAPVAEGPELRALREVAPRLNSRIVQITPDDQDVRQLMSGIETNVVRSGSQGSQRWQDIGYWLVPVTAALVFLWFRPGWLVRTS